jgi:hypothetical protein
VWFLCFRHGGGCGAVVVVEACDDVDGFLAEEVFCHRFGEDSAFLGFGWHGGLCFGQGLAGGDHGVADHRAVFRQDQ